MDEQNNLLHTEELCRNLRSQPEQEQHSSSTNTPTG